MFGLVAFASVVTLHCEAFDIAVEPKGPRIEFAVTMDYDQSFAYFTGSEVFRTPLGIGGVTVTPDRIAVPGQRGDNLRTMTGAVISRTTGEVRLQIHDLEQEQTDLFAGTPRRGRSLFVGICRPGEAIPVPTAQF